MILEKKQKKYYHVRNHTLWIVIIFVAIAIIPWNNGGNIVDVDIDGEITYRSITDNLFFVIPAKGGAVSPYLGRSVEYNKNRDIRSSPRNKLALKYDKKLNRYYIHHPEGKKVYFKYWCLSSNEIDWSPDSRYVVYRADGDESEWTARIYIMDTNSGDTFYLINGDVPRWNTSKRRVRTPHK